MLGQLYREGTNELVEVWQYEETVEWDRRSLGATITAGAVFNYFMREGGTDLRDTSMNTAGQVPAGQEWIVTTIQVVPAAGISEADLVLFMDNAVLSFVRQDVTIFHSPAQHIVAGTGIAGSTNASGAEFVSLGTPSPMAVVPFSTGILLPELIPWRIRLEFPDATTLSAAVNFEIAMRILKRTTLT